MTKQWQSEDERRAYNREAQRRRREKMSNPGVKPQDSVKPVSNHVKPNRDLYGAANDRATDAIDDVLEALPDDRRQKVEGVMAELKAKRLPVRQGVAIGHGLPLGKDRQAAKRQM